MNLRSNAISMTVISLAAFSGELGEADMKHLLESLLAPVHFTEESVQTNPTRAYPISATIR